MEIHGLLNFALQDEWSVRKNLSLFVEKEIECDQGISGPGGEEIILE